MVSPAILIGLAPLAIWMALTGRTFAIVMLDILIVVLNPDWELGGIRFDASDVFLATIALGLVLRPGKRADRQIPHLGAWALYGTLVSISYLSAPLFERYLTGLPQIGYQLYRYCWKGLLYYPLAFLVLRGGRSSKLFLALLAAADVIALMTIPQGYAGDRPGGPFGHGNALGGALVVPFVVASSGLIFPGTRRQWWFAIASTALIGRAIMFSGSRGAFVACLGATAVMLGVPFYHGTGRARAVRFIGTALALFTLVVVAKPDVFERPTVKRMIAAGQPGEVDTFQWRAQERWPFFMHKVTEHPFLGVGTDVAMELGDDGNTPHNGFLSIAVSQGVPALVVMLVLGILGLRDGLATYRFGTDAARRSLGIVAAAGVTGLLVHNMVDSIFDQPFATKLFWLCTGLGALVRQEERLARGAQRRAVRGEEKPAAEPEPISAGVSS